MKRTSEWVSSLSLNDDHYDEDISNDINDLLPQWLRAIRLSDDDEIESMEVDTVDENCLHLYVARRRPNTKTTPRRYQQYAPLRQSSPKLVRVYPKRLNFDILASDQLELVQYSSDSN